MMKPFSPVRRLVGHIVDPRLWQLAAAHPRALVTTVGLQLAITVTCWAQAAGIAVALADLARGVHEHTAPSLTPLAAVAGCVALRGWLVVAHARASTHLGRLVRHGLRARLLTRLLAPGRLYDADERLGSRRLALTEGVEGIDAYVSRYIAAALQVWILCPLAVGIIALLSPAAAIALSVCLLVAVLAPRLWHRVLAARGSRRWGDYEDLSADYLESLRAMSTLRILGAVSRRRALLHERSDTLYRSTVATLRTSLVDTGLVDLGIQAGLAAAAGLAALQAVGAVDRPATSTYLVLLLASEAFRPVRELARHWHAGYLGTTALTGIDAALAGDERAMAAPSDAGRRLVLQDVSFGHDPAAPVLRGASIDLAPGELVALVGPSGSGKSTLGDLVLGLLEPQGGIIRRPRRVAVVPQHAFLFAGSVADTVRTCARDADESDLWRALDDVGLADEVRSWPDGLDTQIGEGGGRLSGGQRQRLAIARALLADADLLLLDEPTSALDTDTAARVCATLRAQSRERVVMMIAHRPEAIAAADRVLCIQDGQVVETEAVRDRRDTAVPAPAPARTATPEDCACADDATGPTSGTSTLRDLAALLPALRTEVRALSWTAFVDLVSCAALIALAIATSHVVATAVLQHRLDDPAWWWALGLLAALRPLLTWHEMDRSHAVAYRVLAALRMALFDGFARGVPSPRGVHSGRLAATAMTDVEKLEFFYAHTVAQLVAAGALVGICTPALAIIAPACAVVLGVSVALLVLVTAAAHHRAAALGDEQQGRLADLSERVVDVLSGTRELLVLDQVGVAHDTVQRAAQQLDAPTGTLRQVEAVGAWARDAVVVLTSAAMVVLVPAVTTLDAVWVPCLVAGTMALLAPVADAVAVAATLQPHRASARRVAEGIALGHDPSADHAPSSAAATQGSPLAPPVVVDGARFRYPGRPPVVMPAITVATGQHIGVAGPSGVGKSTLARLLVGLWRPDAGRVLVHGLQPSDLRPADRARLVQLVEQDAPLLHGTVADNLRLGAPHAEDSALLAALDRVGLSAGGPTLPAGLDTPVGEGGVGLSGGERARIALARALVLDPRLLVLDETTASLDAESEQAVLDAVAAFPGAAVVISHRAATLERLDAVVRWD